MILIHILSLSLHLIFSFSRSVYRKLLFTFYFSLLNPNIIMRPKKWKKWTFCTHVVQTRITAVFISKVEGIKKRWMILSISSTFEMKTAVVNSAAESFLWDLECCSSTCILIEVLIVVLFNLFNNLFCSSSKISSTVSQSCVWTQSCLFDWIINWNIIQNNYLVNCSIVGPLNMRSMFSFHFDSINWCQKSTHK
jgi:hypothetical protein